MLVWNPPGVYRNKIRIVLNVSSGIRPVIMSDHHPRGSSLTRWPVDVINVLVVGDDNVRVPFEDEVHRIYALCLKDLDAIMLVRLAIVRVRVLCGIQTDVMPPLPKSNKHLMKHDLRASVLLWR